jgi:hypothetical protein
MVAAHKADDRLVREVAAVYEWLDSQIRESANLAGRCDACGRCCDFEAADHRLFVTTVELMYLAASLGAEGIRPMETARCPYQVAGQCGIYEHRFAGCRIFCCRADKDFQASLSESALREFKSICTRHRVPYRYCDLAAGLSSLFTDTCQSAGEPCPEGRAD